MPTGYTADLYEGKDVSLPQFVLTCARAFGATVTMRDEPLDAPIPDEFAPSDYHERRRAEARAALAEAEAWTDEDAAREAGRDYAKALAAYRESERKRLALKQRYEAMLDQVLAWEPPTDDHVNLKTFMVEQLQESIRFDCTPLPEPTREDPATYKARQVKRHTESIAYHAREHAAEIARAEGRTQWVSALRQSLAAPSSEGEAR